MMKKTLSRWLIAVVVIAGISLATAITLLAAEKIPFELQGVGIDEKLGASVDLNLTFRNEKGETVPLKSAFDGRRPVLLFLAYYGCPNLCNMFLNGATDVLKQFEWMAGKEFEIVTVSFDPTEKPELAAAKKQAHLNALGKPEASSGWHFWVNNIDRPAPRKGEIEETNARKLANQVGFNYRYDNDQKQYAHAASIVVLTPDGKVSRYLYGIAFQPKDLRLALVEASKGRIGNVVDRFMLFCYNYDPKTRKYSLYATNLMRAGGGLTVLIVGSVLMLNFRRSRRREI